MFCKYCKTEKPIENFDPHKNGKRLKKFCRDCCSFLSKEASRGLRRKRRRERIYGKGFDYESRYKYLRYLGFKSYKEYLASDLWKEIRRKAFKCHGRECYLCDKPATELHHNRYSLKDLQGKRLKFIKPVCRQCHEEIEFKNGEKATVGQAKMAFNRKRKHKTRAEREAQRKETAKRKRKEKKRRRIMSQMAADKAFHERMCDSP